MATYTGRHRVRLAFGRGERNPTVLAKSLRASVVAGTLVVVRGRIRLFYRAFPQLRAQIPSSMMTEFGKFTVPPATPEIPSPAMTNSVLGIPPPCTQRTSCGSPGPIGLSCCIATTRGIAPSTRVVLLKGARQTGKSTIAAALAKARHGHYLSLDE